MSGKISIQDLQVRHQHPKTNIIGDDIPMNSETEVFLLQYAIYIKVSPNG